MEGAQATPNSRFERLKSEGPRLCRMVAKISAPFSDSYVCGAVHGDVAAALVRSIGGEQSSVEG
jgi:hypothetical protein